ncbi:thiol-disulfide oxidoreductase DCC family protein [Hymenobacter sp. BT186]|uniref:Thiol-disulfide oxidoreductase DCC family protein n=1 Tax=Hymenobacter telluris TaxID=2816474 RepID=A0A939F1J8_9BACT|nr:thiol-disulfide oxidoreductase DCC family protein [Hymenobacter telluris]MBO0361051.1 thiol-disulfide oxidoreductase DCC family protein [Hymenobacter telluris]MBW3377079.1 thiol-disulfide oxidoreductase DCC family protein [Hymenobacter norwichensis]
MASPAAVILFDGVCNLCNGFVQFVINHDPAGRFQFTSLQSEAGRQLLAQHGIPAVIQPETVMLVENGRVYTHSTAALRVLRRLRGPWPLLYAGMLVPRLLRDWVYRFIARHRYQWFGRKESCWLPTPELKARFL